MEWPFLKTVFRERLGKLWLFTAFLLVAALAFEAGWLKRSISEAEPVLITSPSILPAPAEPERQVTNATSLPAIVDSDRGVGESTNCAFVGSKKSNKYHVPASRCAKQIKTENRLCFDSIVAAEAKGYVPGCLE